MSLGIMNKKSVHEENILKALAAKKEEMASIQKMQQQIRLKKKFLSYKLR
jgi:hypothetical protein